MANLLTFSPRVKNFVDAADVGGNIKNNSQILQYLNQIDNACIKAGITTGAVYPFIGGNATSHSFNFLNPAQYQINWNGGITHSINGVQSDGTTGYGDTGIPANAFTVSTGASLGFYANDGFTLRDSREIGASGTGSNMDFNSLQLRVGFTNNQLQFISFGNYNGIGTIPALTAGFYLGNKAPSVNNKSTYKSANIISTSSALTDVNISATQSIAILGIHTATAYGNFSNKRTPFINITNGTTDVQAKVFSHDIYVAQRTLERA